MTPEHKLLQQAPWAKQRTEECNKSAFLFSSRFLRFSGIKLVGLVRFLTDTRTVTFICDLIVDDKYRNRGLGKGIMAELIETCGNTIIVVLSGDAGGFYEKLGFIKRECWVRYPK